MDKLLFKRILVAALTLLAIIYVAYLLIKRGTGYGHRQNLIGRVYYPRRKPD